MKFVPTQIAGAWLIHPEPIEDERGWFARVFCQREFAAHGLNPELVQSSLSFNARRGTLRGLHFQVHPHAEDKIVRCTRGSVFDVLVDLRRASASFCRWESFDLTANNRAAIYIPRGVAHGFQTLTDDAELFYQMSEFHYPELSRGLRWNDPTVRISWPEEIVIISERDRKLPALADIAEDLKDVERS